MYMSELYHIFNKIKNKLRVCKVESIYNDSILHSDYMAIFIVIFLFTTSVKNLIVLS